jgi:hypothetical protein
MMRVGQPEGLCFLGGRVTEGEDFLNMVFGAQVAAG